MKIRKCPRCNSRITNNYCTYCGADYSGGDYGYATSDIDEARMFALDFLKSMKNATIVFTVIMVIVFVILLLGEKLSFTSSSDYEGAVADAIWANEHFARWDEQYSTGDYETLCEFIEADINGDYHHPYSSWKHYEFYRLYRDCRELPQDISRYDNNPSKYGAQGILYSFMKIYGRGGESNYSFSENENIALDAGLAAVSDDFCRIFGVTPEDFDSIFSELSPSGYIRYDAIEEYVANRLNYED